MKSKIKTASANTTLTVKPAIRITLIVVVFVLTYLFFSKKIIFVNADLGRHLMNGEVFLEQHKPISTNFYSYTEPNFKTINHHWGSGVIFYLVQQTFGFKGLSVFFALLSAFTVLLMFLIAEKKSHSYIAFLTFAVCLPLIADRTEIRPEIFSLLLLSAFYYLLESYQMGAVSFKALLISLFLLQLLWVNLHIFFIMGIILISIYGLNDVVNKKEKAFKKYAFLLGVALLACFVNPFGLEGVLTPLTIFKNYGYMVAENQSVFFMQNRFHFAQYLHFEVLMGAAIILLLYATYTFKMKKNIPEVIIIIVFGILGFKAIRGIPVMCLFLVPIISFVIREIIERKPIANNIKKLSFVLGIITCLYFIGHADTNGENNYLTRLGKAKGFNGNGLHEQIQHSAAFYKQLNISGPIFNNYDIGGYLIYHLYPKEKVFVDNRPEAYSVDFFNKIYNPMLEKEDVWLKMDSTYKFNCIYFFRLDETTYGQPFLIRRVADRKNWAPIYVDDVAIIFLKRNEKNAVIISKYELPPSTFNSTPTQ